MSIWSQLSFIISLLATVTVLSPQSQASEISDSLCSHLLNNESLWFPLNDDLRIPPAVGRLVAPPFRTEEDNRVFYLGSGHNGAKVYRVLPRLGDSYIEKIYQNEKDSKDDLARFGILRKVASAKDYSGFNVGVPISIAWNRLRLKDKLGRTVGDILYDSRINIQVRNEVQQRYEYLLKKTVSALKKTYSDITIDFTGEIKFTDSWGKERELYLHRGNILVNPITHILTIIDPYQFAGRFSEEKLLLRYRKLSGKQEFFCKFDSVMMDSLAGRIQWDIEILPQGMHLGRYEMDNGWIERAIRKFANGRSN